jgi:predicted ATP-grasp superfamily ATP-dependent carboligase
MSQLSRSQPIQPEDDRSLSTPRRSGRVLVLGTDQRVILAVARSLGRQGLAVELGWCAPQAPATRSRYVVRTHTIPAYARDDDRWKCVLLDLLDRETYDLVIPCNDSTLVPLIAHRSDFDRFPEIYVLPDNVFSIVSDKFKTYELAVAQSVNVPRGFVVDATADPSRLIDVLGLPIVLKPQSTFTVRNRDLANVVCKARDRDELRSQLERLGLTPCLAQQNFGGRGVGVEMLVRQGEILFAFQHERLHESMEWGSSYRRSVAVQPELLDASRRMMRAIGYTGVAMAEYMVDPDSGRWVFLEINGRFWGSLPLAVAAGADFPWFLYQMLVEGRRDFDPAYRLGVRCRNLSLDLDWIKRTYAGDGWRRLGLPLGLALQLVSAATHLDHWDTFSLDDPSPQWSELRAILKRRLGRSADRQLPELPQPESACETTAVG